MEPPRAGSPKTLVDVLRRHVAQRGEQTVYTFLADGEDEQDSWTFAEVDLRARAIAVHLQAQGMAGQRALLLYNPGLDFIAAFLGCLYAGTIAVPAFPPASKRHWPRLRAIADDAQPQWALTASAELSKIRRVADKLAELAEVRWLATDTVDLDRADAWTPPPIEATSLAFLQYTSGSTSTPKGVMVSHGNLLHNEEVIRRGFGLDDSAIIAGWLPLYHDMGLIGNLLQPLYLGARLVFMAPVAFLQKPIRWLQAISKYRATTSGGPNFAYDLCCQRIDGEQKQDLDLSCWQVAFSGAEPVRAETLDQFATAFAPCGFQPGAFYPCYGMAETTLMTTGGDPTAPPVVQTFDAAALEANRAVPSKADDGRALVGCGHRGWQLEVVIADRDRGVALNDGEVGEIWVSGDSVALGYWQRPEASAEIFGARLAGAPDQGPYLRTGDLGFLADGELFVTGRAKDLIILRGRNHYPQDIERTAELSHDDLRPGSGAAVAVEIDGEERLVVIYEIERHPKDDPEVIAEAVRRQVSETHEVQVHEVVLIRVATVPKTSSGKIQRHACRQEYLDGSLTVVGNSRLATSHDETAAPEVLLSREALMATEAGEQAALLLAFLVDRVARLAKVPRAGIDTETPLTGLGLDSLTSVQLKNDIEERLGVMVPLEVMLDGASLQQLSCFLLNALEGAPPATLFAIADPAVEAHPLSHGQRALWYLHRLDPESAAYNISGAAKISAGQGSEMSRLDMSRLERAARHLVQRHSVLRTTYRLVNGEPVAKVGSGTDLDFQVVDFQTIEANGSSQEALRQRLTAEAERPFDLENGPVLRLVIYQRPQDSHLLLAMHHIAGDFWSLALLLRELAQLYDHFATAELALQPLEATYADFVADQARKLEGSSADKLWSYWGEQLGGELPVLDLPLDRPRPAVQSFHGALAHRTFDSVTSRGLRQLAKQQGITLYMLLLSLYQMLLQRYSGQDDILVGSPFTLRSHAALEPLVGYFVNPLVLRGDLSDDPEVTQLLARNRATVLQAFGHRDAPFPWLAERLAPPHDVSRSQIFQTLFVLQKDRPGEEGVAAFSLGKGGAQLAFGEQTLESVPLSRRSAQFDLTLQVADSGDDLSACLEYNSDLFDAATAERWLEGLHRLAQGVVAAPHRRLSQLALLDDAERRQVLSASRTPELDDGENSQTLCLHHLVLRQARKTPQQTAISWYPEGEGDEAQHWTYRQLDNGSRRVAEQLHRLGIGPEDRVAICSPRRPELLVGLLGILRSGAAYVPLDPAYPGARLEFILDDSQSSVLLHHGELPDSLETADASLPRLDLADLLGSGHPDEASSSGAGNAKEQDHFPADQLAYLIYTSGSTGRPKGVAISHRNAATMVRWGRREFSAEQLRVVLAATSVCFDLSVYEIFLPLSVGGRVVVVEHALELPRLPAEAGITLVNTVPSAMAQLAGGLPPSVHTVNLAGEPLVRNLVDRIHAQDSVQAVYNLYGPSEDTTYSTWVQVPADGAEEPTIGWAVAQTNAYVVDLRLNLVPQGVAGELLLSGDKLSRGYLGRPALTAEKYVPDPFAEEPGNRLYRTGDLVRQRVDGELEFLGRLDHQVKIRGFRIELGEVEQGLEQHPKVLKSVVMAKSLHDEPLLVAYLATGSSTLESSEIRNFLAAKLPAYMVPQVFVQLPELPLTPNGKIHRKALPEPQLDGAQGDFVAPSTAVEEMLVDIWQEVLAVERIGIHDSFFDLGGHSLMATRVLSQVQENFGVDLPIRSLLEAPTVYGLAEAIAEHLMADVDEETLASLMAEMDTDEP